MFHAVSAALPCRYGLTPEQQKEAEAVLEELAAAHAAASTATAAAAAADALPPDINILGKGKPALPYTWVMCNLAVQACSSTTSDTSYPCLLLL